jgi:membrane-associated protein
MGYDGLGAGLAGTGPSGFPVHPAFSGTECTFTFERFERIESLFDLRDSSVHGGWTYFIKINSVPDRVSRVSIIPFHTTKGAAMELLAKVIDFVFHLDAHLSDIIQTYGLWTYSILFMVIFCETGLVVTPFLPGDSLLFAAGTFAARGDLKVGLLFLILAAAAVLGDTVNYWLGKIVGPKVFHKEKTRFFKKEYLDRTHTFYEKYGAETIIIARFVPIIRTFAPFVAGIGRMTYGKFLSYNVIGGVGWVAIFTFGGYFFGNIPFVKKNFSIVIIVIIVLSLVPAVVEFFKHKKKKG